MHLNSLESQRSYLVPLLKQQAMDQGNVECGGRALNFVQIERGHLRRFPKQQLMYTSCVYKCVVEVGVVWAAAGRDPKEFKEGAGTLVDLIMHAQHR